MRRTGLPALLLLLGALAGACAPARPGEPDGSDEPGRVVPFSELLATISSCHGREREALALRDEAAFAEAWTRAGCEGRERPLVDFGREMALVALGEEGPTGCYSVRIAEVRTGVGGGYGVVVERHVPESSAVCPMVVVHPAHVVRVPRVRGPVDFEWRTVIGPPAEDGAGG